MEIVNHTLKAIKKCIWKTGIRRRFVKYFDVIRA